MKHEFKKEDHNLLTEHYDITNFKTILEFYLNGQYYYYEFDNNHKIIEKQIWKITTMI